MNSDKPEKAKKAEKEKFFEWERHAQNCPIYKSKGILLPGTECTCQPKPESELEKKKFFDLCEQFNKFLWAINNYVNSEFTNLKARLTSAEKDKKLWKETCKMQKETMDAIREVSKRQAEEIERLREENDEINTSLANLYVYSAGENYVFSIIPQSTLSIVKKEAGKIEQTLSKEG